MKLCRAGSAKEGRQVVATRQQDGERRTEAHERRSFGKARGQRRWQHRRERGSRRAAENPGGEHPGEEEVKRGSGSRDRVTPAWCNGLARCENPQGRATASGTWRRAENFGSKREKRPGRRRRDGEGGNGHREVSVATGQGKTLKAKAQGRYGMKQGRKWIGGTRRQEVEKT